MKSLRSENIKTSISILIIATLCIIVLFGLCNTSSMTSFCFDNANLCPSLLHIFGTDNYGRDMFLITLSGLSISLIVGIIASLISVIIAIFVAVTQISKSRFLSKSTEVLTNITLGIPHIVLMILISFSVGKGGLGAILAVGLTHWANLSRILGNELKQINMCNWMKIEKNLGNSNSKLLFLHILPNIKSQIVVGFSLALPHAILHESTLTYLGFGFTSQTPTIGNILSESLNYSLIGNWWMSVFPGLVLIASICAVTYISKRIENRI